MELPHFAGWHLIGAFPNHEPDDVGSWLLVNDGEALLLEILPGLSVADVQAALVDAGTRLIVVTASHDHEDHLDTEAWYALAEAFPDARFMHPASVNGDQQLHVGGEALWLLKAPKHSATDVVTIFRGVAMTGDIELGMLGSVNDEVPVRTKKTSMRRLAEFESRADYHVHSIVSAHLNDVRTSIRWPDLFEYEGSKRKFCRRCGGKLIPIARDFAGFDRKCEDCGRTEWSDPAKLQE